MKISKIEIKDFHQFKDLTIDLTYPKGHAKEGQPLDKVCFIGQSGTGKTSLLELIPKYAVNYNTHLITKSGMPSLHDKVEVSFVFGENNKYTCRSTFSKNSLNSKINGLSNWIWSNDDINTDIAKSEKLLTEAISFIDNWQQRENHKLIYFPANLLYNDNIKNDLPPLEDSIIDFSQQGVSYVWDSILAKIQLYQEKELQIRQEISKAIENSKGSVVIDVIENAAKKLKEWKQSEFNPIQDIADNCLNALLHSFKLKVKTELDIKSKADLGFIKIEDKSGNEIPHDSWSTGTKQVIYSAMPLYQLKPMNTIILFDEPERSLYPDLQRLIVDYYSSLTENCQFFYSTHSPIIASNFEPWEIVELKFNEEGKIYRELYYEGENHVDNYKWNPKQMRWDDILQRIFDMENDGGPERKKLLDELAETNVKFKKLGKQGKGDTEEAKKLLSKIEILSKELSHWD
ncbi:MAG: AAA family ATPase [Bacteroidota bacterium]